MQRELMRIAIVVLTLFCGGAAQASALSDSWKCAKNAGMSSVSIGADLYKKGETLAKDAGPLSVCLAKTGPEGQALIATSSAITALRLAKPSLLPKGQCEPRIKGIVTKPFAMGIASILPNGGAKTSLLNAANSEMANGLVWDQIGQLPPPFSSVPNQIECGCLISDGALTLADISAITNAIAKTSESCATMLDSLGLGFINDIGSYAGKLGKSLAYGASGKWDEWVTGQSDPLAPGAVFEIFFGKYLDGVAVAIAKDPKGWPGTKFNNTGGPGCSYDTNSGTWGPGCYVTLDELAGLCATYYDEHKMSLSNGKKACASYKETVVVAATPLAKRYAAETALPGLFLIYLKSWVDDQWAWRLPKRAGFEQADGSMSVVSWSSLDAQNQFSAITGSASKVPSKVSPGQGYDAVGVLATAKTLLNGVQFDPNLAVALAFAGAQEPARDKARETWGKERFSYALVQLQEWLPKPVMGYRYGCAPGLAKECATAMEARFDKSCFKPLSELYLTGPSIKGQTGLAFVARLNDEKKKCLAVLAPVLPASQKIAAGLDAHIKNQCTADRYGEMNAACVAEKSAGYKDCALTVMQAGKDDVGQCLSARSLGTDILKQLGKPKPKPDDPTSRKP